jgi:hypothetical protein
MAEAFIGFFILAVALIWVYLGLQKLAAYVDRRRPRRDYLAERKRRITHNAFKSRAGIR